MRMNMSALQAAIQFSYSAEELSSLLGDVGIEVEDIVARSALFTNVRIARVVSVESHPSLGRLSVVTVDMAEHGVSRACTAAANVLAGDCIPVVLPGGQTADGMRIEPRSFDGVESQGMLCSWRELGLDGDLLTSDEKEGIFHLGPGAPIGRPFETVWPVADTALEVSVTPDRADALSVLGIARWIETLNARASNRPFDMRNIRFPIGDELPTTTGTGNVSVSVVDPALCSTYIAVEARNITVGRSNFEFRCLLYRLCVRPVNSIVDMTNACLKQYGQPTHAFDGDRLAGHQIVVRPARSGETIVTLDGEQRSLEQGMLVIADAERPVAIAGVMGGFDSAVTAQTRNVVFEIAHFEPRAVAYSSRHLGLKTDASFLFERGTDIGATISASASLLSMLVREQMPDAQIACVATAGIPTLPRAGVPFATADVNDYLGTMLSSADVVHLLGYEGIGVAADGEKLTAQPPSFRGDLASWPDVVEEVVRMQGYEAFPVRIPVGTIHRGRQSPMKGLAHRLRDILCGLGLHEVRTVSFVHDELVRSLGLPDPAVIVNPLSSEWNALRPSLLVGLAGAALRNLSRDQSGFSCFEIGTVFVPATARACDEQTRLGILMTGRLQEGNWTTTSLDADVFVLKGLVEAIGKELHISFSTTTSDSVLFEPGGETGIEAKGLPIGELGILRRRTAALLGLETPVFYAEISIGDVLAALPTPVFRDFSRFPSVHRDIAILVDQEVSAGALEQIIRSYAGSCLNSASVFDCFVGNSIPAGKKSVGFSLEFSSPERTLQSEDVDTAVSAIEEALTTQVGGVLRRTRE